MSLTIGQNIRGRVHCWVVDSRTQETLKDYGWQDNLILNQGLNNICLATHYSSLGGTYCVIGSGSTPTKDLSGATNAVQAGTTVTISGGSFVFTNTATDAGKMIKWGSGEEAMIVTVTNPTTAEVNLSQTVVSGPFTVYRTQQTGLTTELKRTNTYLQGVDFCGSTQNPRNVMTHRRTYDFTAETGPVTYREMGFSHLFAPGANLFSRILLAVPVVLGTTNQLRVTYDLIVTYSPAVSYTGTFPITGWPVAPSDSVSGQGCIANLQSYNIDIDGTPGGTIGNDQLGLEIAALNYSMLSVNAIPIQPEPVATANGGTSFATSYNAANQIGATNSRVTAPVLSSYITNSFTRTKTWTFTPALAGSSRTDWKTLLITSYAVTGGGSVTTVLPVLFFVFDQTQTKDVTHRLVITVKWTFSRTLS